MKKLTLSMVIVAMLFALVSTIVAKPSGYDYWNWKCYQNYGGYEYCGLDRCSSPATGTNCTAMCNGTLQVHECEELGGCEASWCSDTAW